MIWGKVDHQKWRRYVILLMGNKMMYMYLYYTYTYAYKYTYTYAYAYIHIHIHIHIYIYINTRNYITYIYIYIHTRDLTINNINTELFWDCFEIFLDLLIRNWHPDIHYLENFITGICFDFWGPFSTSNFRCGSGGRNLLPSKGRMYDEVYICSLVIQHSYWK